MSDWIGGKVVIDTTNPYNPDRSGLLDIGKQTAAEHVNARLPGARYVKAFNTLTAGFLAESAGRTGDDRVVIFLSGDHGDAKTTAATLVHDAGFAPVDLGTLAGSARQEPEGEYYGRNSTSPTSPRSRGFDATTEVPGWTVNQSLVRSVSEAQAGGIYPSYWMAMRS